jgi:hypothetical protein
MGAHEKLHFWLYCDIFIYEKGPTAQSGPCRLFIVLPNFRKEAVMKKLSPFLLVVLLLISCDCRDDDTPDHIEIYFDKIGVIGDGIDRIFIGCDVDNQYDEILPGLRPALFLDGEPIQEGYFSIAVPGYYRVTAEYEALKDSRVLPAFTTDDGGDDPPPVADEDFVDVDLSYQQTQVWCWAACAQMVLTYFGMPYSQADIVTYVFGYPYVTAANDLQLVYAMNGLGHMNAQVVYNPVSFPVLKDMINNGMPLIAGYQGSFMGHVVVIYGYDAYGRIYIHDPYYGSFVVSYDNTFIYTTGDMIWNKTFYNLKPLYSHRGGRSLDEVFARNDPEATVLNIELPTTAER